MYVYDNAVATNHPAAPGPHTWAEISAAFPLAVAPMQDAAANTFLGGRVQYLLNTLVVIGGQVTDGGNLTSLVDTKVDLFCNVTGGISNYRYRSDAGIAPSNIVTTYGTKVGTGKKMGGHSGVSIHVGNGSMTFRGTLGFYASSVEGLTGILFANSGSGFQEVAASLIDAGSSLTLGQAASGPFTIYNSTVAYRGTGNMVTVVDISDSFNTLLVSSAPQTFLTSNSAARKLRGITLSGAVTSSDLSTANATPNWEMTNVEWSDTPGKPRISFGGTPAVGNGVLDYRTFDTKVVDPSGIPLQAIPVHVTSDVDGMILDTQTGFDGQVVFTWAPTSQTNVLPVRDYYQSGGLAFRDRIYTMLVNGYGGTFQPNQNYKTLQFVFSWPGRDRLGTTDQLNGGTFQKVMDLIQLSPGRPSSGVVHTECEI